MGVTEAPGARIAYDVEGPVGAPAVALIHAGVANRTMWDPQWADLASDHRVVRHDTRGFGETVGDATPFSDVDDLLAVLDAAGVERATLVGCSRGGRIALDAALAHPDRVAGIATIGSSPSGWSPGALTPREQELDEAIDAADAAGNRDALIPLELQFWIAGPQRELADLDPAFVARAAWLLRAGEQTDFAGEAIPAARPAADRLGEIAVPALIAVGDRDLSVLIAEAARMAASIPGAEQLVLSDTAHLPSVERADLVTTALGSWLAAHAL